MEEYVRLFSPIIAQRVPGWTTEELVARYQRIRRPARFQGDPQGVRAVFVLSRVTLGADIAVTSVVLDAVRQMFPGSRIVLVGGSKNRELFAADPRIEWLPLEYGRRASLEERLAAGLRLRGRLDIPGALVIDPDSRLTQLGLLPVCEEQRYYFFESRAWGGDSQDALGALTQRWLAEIFGASDARPWIAPAGHVERWGGIAVSLGVGENLAKRVRDPFEEELLRGLAEFGLPILIDSGPGGEEAARARQALTRAGLPARQARLFQGSFAEFALRIKGSRLYVGYDSAGQHAAAAWGVPTVTVFAGYPCERFFARWQPAGPGPKITVRVEPSAQPDEVLSKTLQAATQLLGQVRR